MAKGERNLKKVLAKEKLAEEDKQSYIGALEVNHYVKVNLNNELKICNIIAVRKDPLHEKDENPNDYSYEYYIHYIEYDRRNDHWVKRKSIIETKVSDEEIKKLKNSQLPTDDEIIFHNDENEGMDKAGVKAHEEATKIRTIEEIIMGNYSIKSGRLYQIHKF